MCITCFLIKILYYFVSKIDFELGKNLKIFVMSTFVMNFKIGAITFKVFCYSYVSLLSFNKLDSFKPLYPKPSFN